MRKRGTSSSKKRSLRVHSSLSGLPAHRSPLWLVKKVFRWRLIHGADDAAQSPTGPWQFRLWHLLLATFLIAVALSLIRKELLVGDDCPLPLGCGRIVLRSVRLCTLHPASRHARVHCAHHGSVRLGGVPHVEAHNSASADNGLIWCAVCLVLFSSLRSPQPLGGRRGLVALYRLPRCDHLRDVADLPSPWASDWCGPSLRQPVHEPVSHGGNVCQGVHVRFATACEHQPT